ncbi:hypothetical protein EJ357_43490 [Streptomyces cyaneochromogenes]|uniref:Uncharacterized protein n=1 Tax=Streptomyces cyaneochromogenes TaxID=2496836 RepID=A0A3Q9EZP9_9ACTN|nr:hypothetical protein [Streptomyces cyaneochromogenes]AZQ39452.1 hypothetical protein EJ357_43490 [Streptomyces cyaneochromogenes]
MIASLAGVLNLAGIVYDIARLIAPDEPRRPPLARLRGRRVALEEAAPGPGPHAASWQQRHPSRTAGSHYSSTGRSR